MTAEGDRRESWFCLSVSRPTLSLQRLNAGRTGRARVPLAGMRATRRRLVAPSDTEGFDQVDVVRA
jgi:hypothetical protein